MEITTVSPSQFSSLEEYQRAQWGEFLKVVGTKLALLAQGRCPRCGRNIDLSVEFPKHHCPTMPLSPKKEIKAIILEDGFIVILGARENVIPVANEMTKTYGLRPLIIYR